MSKEEQSWGWECVYIDTYIIYNTYIYYILYIYKRDEVEFRSLHKGLRERERESCWSVDRLECHNWNGRVRLPQDNGLVRVQIINAPPPPLSLSISFSSRFAFAPTIPDSFDLPPPPLPARELASRRGENLVRWPTCSAAGKWRRIRRFWMVKREVSWGRVFPWSG